MTILTGSIDYVRAVLKELELKPSALAKKAGIATTTLTRALNDPTHKFTLTTTTLNKIAKATGISPAPFLEGADQIELAARAFHPADSFDPKLWGKNGSVLDIETRFSALTPVIGTLATDQWQDPTLAATEHSPLNLTIVGHKPRDIFACYVEGTAGEPMAHHNEFVICQRFEQHYLRLHPQHLADLPGVMAVIERRCTKTFRIELTSRLLRFRRGAFELIQFSPQNWREKLHSIRFDSFEEDIGLRIIGIVEEVIRSPLNYDLHREIISNYR